MDAHKQEAQSLSRRSILKLGAAIAVGAPLAWFSRRHPSLAQTEPVPQPARRAFGRVIVPRWQVRELPSIKAPVVRQMARNEVIPILGQIESDESPAPYNKIWYRTVGGWTHSAQVQPCDNNAENAPLTQIDKDAVIWGELTVPLSAARVRPDPKARAPWTHYFGTTHQILEVAEGADKELWYRVSDGIQRNLWVLARHIRIIPPEEFAPLSPHVPAELKRVEVDLRAQRVYAYEDDRLVFEARCATGASFRQPDGTIKSFRTTPGTHRIFAKTPSQRMFDGVGEGQPRTYDLPGIAWVSYFTASGISFHGTYWHNDYGKPRSHGCVNLLPEDAQWIYRWTLPATPYEQRWTRAARREEGTVVRVF
ncbi:MAG: L,D-transpeptidase [Thermoflexales bacterium]|nr:L,D-transpeptidase [Thermoflexales bacterium]